MSIFPFIKRVFDWFFEIYRTTFYKKFLILIKIFICILICIFLIFNDIRMIPAKNIFTLTSFISILGIKNIIRYKLYQLLFNWNRKYILLIIIFILSHFNRIFRFTNNNIWLWQLFIITMSVSFNTAISQSMLDVLI